MSVWPHPGVHSWHFQRNPAMSRDYSLASSYPSPLHRLSDWPGSHPIRCSQQEARLEQEALEEMRRRQNEAEEDERRRLQEAVAKHQVGVNARCVGPQQCTAQSGLRLEKEKGADDRIFIRIMSALGCSTSSGLRPWMPVRTYAGEAHALHNRIEQRSCWGVAA